MKKIGLIDVDGHIIKTGAYIDFSQGLDIRMMTERKAELLAQMKIKKIHFAWDRYEDKNIVQPRFLQFREKTKLPVAKLLVYVLVGDREKKVLPEDLERIYWLRDCGYDPYVMVYEKYQLPPRHELKKLQRWVNSKWIFKSCLNFEDYGKVNK